jgi:ATP-dependent Clp protease, protease subunit
MSISPISDLERSNLILKGIDVRNKSFLLCEEIDEDSLSKVYVATSVLKEIDDDRPIRMYLATPGGDVEAGLGIYDLLRSLPCELEIIVTGYAYSMGIIILQAADRRIMKPHSSIMAHWGRQGVEDTNPENYERKQKFQKSLDDKRDNILLERMKQKKKSMTLKKVKTLTAFDWYLNPTQAIKEGLADKVGE